MQWTRDNDSEAIRATVEQMTANRAPRAAEGGSAGGDLVTFRDQMRQLERQVLELRSRLDGLVQTDDGSRRPVATSDDLIAAAGGAAAWPAFFDLVSLATDSFAVLGTSLAGTGAAWICGVKKTIAASGMTWSTDRWTSGTISASQYVYLDLDRNAASATIVMATTLPDGSHTERIRPLWSIPWIPPAGEVAGYIDTANIVDMRGAKQIEAMA